MYCSFLRYLVFYRPMRFLPTRARVPLALAMGVNGASFWRGVMGSHRRRALSTQLTPLIAVPVHVMDCPTIFVAHVKPCTIFPGKLEIPCHTRCNPSNIYPCIFPVRNNCLEHHEAEPQHGGRAQGGPADQRPARDGAAVTRVGQLGQDGL